MLGANPTAVETASASKIRRLMVPPWSRDVNRRSLGPLFDHGKRVESRGDDAANRTSVAPRRSRRRRFRLAASGLGGGLAAPGGSADRLELDRRGRQSNQRPAGFEEIHAVHDERWGPAKRPARAASSVSMIVTVKGASVRRCHPGPFEQLLRFLGARALRNHAQFDVYKRIMTGTSRIFLGRIALTTRQIRALRARGVRA
jgi:hypothetical protein